MNKWLYFAGGLIVGAVAGALGYRQYLIHTYQEPEEDYSEYDHFEDEEEVNPRMSDEDREEIKEKLSKNYEETTNYAAMYQGDAANHEHPMDSDEDDVEETDQDEEEGYLTDEEQEAYDQTVEHQKNKNKKPKIISAEAVGDLPGYIDVKTLLYYTGNDVLTNEEDEELIPELFIGDALTKYGFDHNDEERIWVMNYAFDTCYEVQKVNGSFSE